jgi:hypothetical protein
MLISIQSLATEHLTNVRHSSLLGTLPEQPPLLAIRWFSYYGDHMFKKFAVAALSVSLLTLTGCQTTGPKYQNVRSYSEGLAPVQTTGGKWGFINEKQQWVIPARFEDAKEFKGGKAAAKLNGKWGFINKRGEWL